MPSGSRRTASDPEPARRQRRQLSAKRRHRQLLGAWNDTISAFGGPTFARASRGSTIGLGPASGLSQRCLNESLGALLEGFSARESKIVIDRAAKCREPLALLRHPRRQYPWPGSAIPARLPGPPPARDLQAGDGRALLHSRLSRRPGAPRAFSRRGQRRTDLARGPARPRRSPLRGRSTTSWLTAVPTPSLLSKIARPQSSCPSAQAQASAVLSDADPDDLPRTAPRSGTRHRPFDQRGCLSLQVIFAQTNIGALAEAMGQALADAAVDLPPGTVSSSDLVRARLARKRHTSKASISSSYLLSKAP